MIAMKINFMKGYAYQMKLQIDGNTWQCSIMHVALIKKEKYTFKNVLQPYNVSSPILLQTHH